MAIHLTARHPSPASVLPRRARSPRHGFEMVETAIAIPEADLGAFAPMEPIPMGPVALYGFHERGGSTWRKLARQDNDVPIPADDVLRFISGEDPAASDEIARALMFTPLQAGRILTDGQSIHPRPLLSVDPDGYLDAGQVVAEERARTAARLRDWAGANLAVAGDAVMVRTPVLAHVHEWHGKLCVYAISQVGITTDGIAGIRPDRARDLCGAMGLPFEDAVIEDGLAALEAWTLGMSTDDDALAVAAHLPSVVHALAAADARAPGYARRIRSREAVAGALDGLRPWRLRGAIGGIGPDEVGPAVTACETACDALARAGVRLPSGFTGRDGTLGQARRRYAARLDEVDPEDVAAISALA